MTAPLGPSLELQGAIVTALKASTDLQSIIGSPIRLYQDVPPNPVFPYITIGDDQNVPDLAQGLDGSEIYLTINVWSRASGYSECKKIGASIKACFPVDTGLSLSENRCLLIERRNEQHMMDQDTITAHGIYTFRALVEPAA